MNRDLFLSILAMDACNRGDAPNVFIGFVMDEVCDA